MQSRPQHEPSYPGSPQPHPSASGGPHGTGAPTPARPPGTTMRLIGRILTGLGAVVVVLGIVLGVVAGMKLGELGDTFDKGTSVKAKQTGTVQVTKGQTMTIWVVDASGKKGSCDTHGPRIDSDNHENSSLSFSNGGKSYDRLATITPKESGSLRVVCDVDVDITSGEQGSSLGTGIVGIVGAVFVGLAGLLLLVVGAILWFLGGRTVARSRTGA